MAHTRNGKAAKARRQGSAKDRQHSIKQFNAWLKKASPEERLLAAIFGGYEKCEECFSQKLLHADCMTPHCKAAREDTDVQNRTLGASL